MVVIIDPTNEKETVIVNDAMQLKSFYNQHKSDIWCGFNSRNFDQYILKSILCGFDPYDVTEWIIGKKRKGWEYSNTFNRIPLISYDVMTGYHGLKTLEAFMGNDIRETTVPFDIDRPLTQDEIEQTIFYCRHDVQQTIEVFLKRRAEFDSQMELIKEFNLPLSDLGKTQTQLSAKILGARRVDFDDEFDIRLPDNIIMGKYQYVADWFLSIKSKVESELGYLNYANRDEWRKLYYSQKLETLIGKIPHIVAGGGLHGSEDNLIYECKEDEVMIMADVGALYPSIMIQYDLLSRCVSNKNRFINVYNTNLRLKNEGNKKRRAPYKLICNKTYGATGDPYNPMYDPLHRNLVCIFGQLFLIDLIDKLEDYCRLIQSNTDGILILVKKNMLPKINEIIHEWEVRTRLNMEQDEYVRLYQKDVNNYILVDAKGGYKCKGGYVKEQDDLDYDLPIINEAITEYFVNNTPIETTINNCGELIKFQKVVKISHKYLRGWHNGEWLSDRTFRVFASKNDADSCVGKQKEAGATIEKFANTPDHCFIDNSDIKGKRIPRRLDIQWYIDLANKRLRQFFGQEEQEGE